MPAGLVHRVGMVGRVGDGGEGGDCLASLLSLLDNLLLLWSQPGSQSPSTSSVAVLFDFAQPENVDECHHTSSQVVEGVS